MEERRLVVIDINRSEQLGRDNQAVYKMVGELEAIEYYEEGKIIHPMVSIWKTKCRIRAKCTKRTYKKFIDICEETRRGMIEFKEFESFEIVNR